MWLDFIMMVISIWIMKRMTNLISTAQGIPCVLRSVLRYVLGSSFLYSYEPRINAPA
jgi:hypothetical protein